MLPPSHHKLLPLILVTGLGLAACGGGGGGGTPANVPPSANAGADQSVNEGSSVNLAGSGTDTDGTITAYAWLQTSGPAVTLSNANTATASFTAPQVGAATQLGFRLTVTDNGSLSASDEVLVTVNDTTPPPPSVTVSGKVSYDYVPHNPTTSGLDYNAISQRPVRGAVMEAVNAGTFAVVSSTDTDTQGNYSLSVPSNFVVFLRVKAQSKRIGTPSWDFQVVDNTNNKALYALSGASFDTGTADSVRNLNAASGWGGTSYTGTRAAAPFAILDDAYQAYTKVLSADGNAQFAPLKLNWSINNRDEDGDKSLGQIGTSHYQAGEIFILGKEDVDTDEYDDHVVIHEWGHYFEDHFSRSDSIGGEHGGGDRLDMRVAFGEGWGNAWSGMATDDPVYHDSLGNQQAGANSFSINVDNNAVANMGWFSEGSVQAILYDLYDNHTTGDSGADQLALGYGPIHAVMTGAQKTTPALTSVFSFVSALKAANPVQAAGIDLLVTEQGIDSASIDAYGSNETHAGGATRDVLPVYLNGTAGTALNVCTNTDIGTYNKLGNSRFARYTLAQDGMYRIVLTRGAGGSDPDFRVFQNQQVAVAESGPAANETKDVSLKAGDMVIAATEAGTYSGQVCMSLTVSKL
ncbi:MAG: hypothetical protein HYV16_07465 [Gammaproteobacteria bacterium]|nr:hypothetical protein [Gammaproteobacteria bacterium]